MRFVFLTLFSCSIVSAEWRWSYEPILANKDASACHFIGSAYLAGSLERVGLKWWQADLAALGAGLAWEIKDGLVPWERYGWIGGEGFSAGDVACDAAGIAVNRLFHVILKEIKNENSNNDPGASACSAAWRDHSQAPRDAKSAAAELH